MAAFALPWGASEMAELNIPRHVAVVMDGNGRWARKRLLPRVEGHRAGAKTLRMMVEESRRAGVRYLTVFAFSTENWRRPFEEVSALMRLLEQHLRSETAKLLENDVRLRAIGDLEKLSPAVREALSEAERQTADCKGMDLLLALSYGGRSEIVQAVRHLAREAAAGQLQPDEIDEESVRQHLYAPDVPDPDLLIRTSGEMRISNFLLWQLAYTELIVTRTLWPDLSREEYLECLREFGKRGRRFGLTGQQVGEDS